MTSPPEKRSGPGGAIPAGRSRKIKAAEPAICPDHSARCGHSTALRNLVRPPEYRSAEYNELPAGHPLRSASMRFAADCWAEVTSSPHIAELLAEWVEWVRRRDAAGDSQAISAVADWRAMAAAPTYAEMERRRSVPGALHQAYVSRHGHEPTGGPVDWETGRPLPRHDDALRGAA